MIINSHDDALNAFSPRKRKGRKGEKKKLTFAPVLNGPGRDVHRTLKGLAKEKRIHNNYIIKTPESICFLQWRSGRRIL